MSPSELFLALVAYPVLEELVFRLHGMRLVADAMPRAHPDLVNACVSVVFALCHLANWTAGHALAVFFPSMVLGRVMQRTGRWSLCALLHAGMNACYLIGTR